MNELVSIITPSYNTDQFIGKTIESVMDQSYQEWEHLIIDDGSADDSWSILGDFAAREARIRLFRNETNEGPARARNLGIREAKGRYIAFLDSDDLWAPDKLERQIAFMKEKSAVFSYSAYQKIDEAGEIRGEVISVPESISYHDLLQSCVIGCLTAIYDQSIIGKQYMPDISRGQDYGLWLKILREGHRAHGLNEPLAFYRIRKDSISRNKLRKAGYQWLIYRDVEKLGIFKSLYYMMNYAYYGYMKFKR